MFQLWSWGALSVDLYVPLMCQYLFFFSVFLYFLELQDAVGSSCMFSAVVVESNISQRQAGSDVLSKGCHGRFLAFMMCLE